jgi:hypothetical protein
LCPSTCSICARRTRSRDLKFFAIALALLSLLFAALAASEWSESPDESERHRPGRIILLLVSSLSVAILWIGATELGWPRHRTLWVGVGAFLAVMTLLRPWWFWDNQRARWLRGLIGDEPTAGLYLAVATAMIWVGLFTEWSFGR